MKMTRILVALFFTAFSLQAALAAGFDNSSWDKLLKSHVKAIHGNASTAVDYAGMARDKARLDAYLDASAKVSRSQFDQWNKEDQLAFLINIYNARTVALILTAYPDVKSIKDLGGLFSTPWKVSDVPLFGKSVSLDDIEHKLIRGSGRYNDPRIHFAVNCASIGCPSLRRQAYEGAVLDSQLSEQSSQFLGDRSRNRFEKGTLRLSPLFKWYADDFNQGAESAPTLPEFLASHGQALGLTEKDKAKLRKGSIPVKYLNYDWQLNDIKN